MISKLEGEYELADKSGSWTYKRLSDTSGDVLEASGQIGHFTYAPIAASGGIFGNIFKWDEDLKPSKSMGCIGVTSSEIMRHVQLPESAGAYFVLPSQLNGAEYPNDNAIVREVEDYIYDNTGGPRGQLAAHPGAAQFVLDNAASWAKPEGINAIDHILAEAPQFKLKNGYMVMPECDEEPEAKKLFEGFTKALHGLRPLIMHDLSACGLTPDKEGMSIATHRVGLVYASAVPVDSYTNRAKSPVARKLHQKVAEAVLVAQYFGALRAVALRPEATKPAKVFLLPLGGGVFNNSFESIVRAMAQAVELLAGEPGLLEKLRVQVLAWSGSPAEAAKLEGLLESYGKLSGKGGAAKSGALPSGGSKEAAPPPPPTGTQRRADLPEVEAAPPPPPLSTQKGRLA